MGRDRRSERERAGRRRSAAHRVRRAPIPVRAAVVACGRAIWTRRRRDANRRSIEGSAQRMKLEGKRILVIGGAGLIGSHLVDELSRTDVGEILVYDNFARGTR